MLRNNQVVRNEKPRGEGETQLQGMEVNNHDTICNYTANAGLKSSHIVGRGLGHLETLL